MSFIFGFIVGFLLVGIPLTVLGLCVYIIEAIALFKLAKNANCKYAWLAWIPLFGGYLRTYLISDIAGNKPFVFFDGKINFQKRINSFWIYLGLGIGGGLITTIIAMIPLIGLFLSPIVSLAFSAAIGIMNYVYLKDMLDVFRNDDEKNKTAALIVTLLDCLVTIGFARAIYLCTIMKLDPLYVEASDEQPIEVTSENA